MVIILQIGNRARARAAMESGRLSWHKGLVAIIWDGVMLREVEMQLIESKTGLLLLQEKADGPLVGILTLHDILRAQQAAAEEGYGNT